MRVAEISRRTAETDIRLRLDLNGTGLSQIETGCADPVRPPRAL